MSPDFLTTCIIRAKQDSTISPSASYYFGLPSKPILVYRTGTPWKRPTGPEAYRIPKEARPVFDHPIADAWDELGPQVPDYLDSVKVMWTTIDIVRFAEVEKDPGPPVLWIGVKPGSLSRKDAEVAAIGCEGLLKKFEITNIEVAFRESLFTRLAGPKGPQLLKYVSSLHATADVRSPLTPALGLRIAAQATPYAEGTGALYIRESSNSKRVFILTARHVVLPPNAWPNKLYTHKNVSQPRHNVLLLGSKAFQDVLESIMVRIGQHAIMVSHYNNQLRELATGVAGDDEDDVIQANRERTKVESLLQEAKAAIDTLNEFHTEVTKYWSAESQRALGHIAYSPPISVGTGTKCFTEDWALIELDGEKIDWKAFKGNVIDLGTKISVHDFILKMYPNLTAATSFKYPSNRLLPLQGVVKDNELRHPTILDANGEPCLFVIKNGASTGVTTGRATGIMSFVREYFPNGNHETSKELAIYPYGYKDGAFSAPGDSGSIIADPMGRIVGLLTGGSGQTDSTDVTYATPFYWLLDERIKMQFPNSCLYYTSAKSP
ncbi:hypothetical protein M378DRAFT_187503 [Amanita muscaria Koide BX008]|uniref:Uncharacterized protein n=1 Tax=Amanita muscaria (strain Koide BX008) TaxID=946122 RepID=A0A0C2T586_AMAMK|nr:hypothetical protein M378DRAFT_187503 [Amanita muscaria Koide BX008]